jgi:hypothetical protein
MKTIITLLLIITLAIPVHAQPKDPQPIAAPIILGCLVLVVGATATYVIIKCHSTNDNDKGPVRVVLERSPDHATWTPIATNTVVLNGQSPIDAFQDSIRNDGAFYRAKAVKP